MEIGSGAASSASNVRAEIDVWRAPSIDLPAATLRVDDVLDGEDIVPGFTYRVADVFADPLG